jgi:hypothetical protein
MTTPSRAADHRRPDQEARDTGAHVDQRQRRPPAFALQDPGLGAHQGQWGCRERDQGGRGEAVEPHHHVDDRSEDEAQHPHPERGLEADPQDDSLDLVHVVRRRGDAARGGRLKGQ